MITLSLNIFSQVRFDITNKVNSDAINRTIDLSEIECDESITDKYDYILVKQKGKGKKYRFVIYYANKDFTLVSKKFNYYIKSYNFDENHVGTYITETNEFGKGKIVIDGLSSVVIIDESYKNNNKMNYKYAD